VTTVLKAIALLRARLAKLLRYAAVSAISTATSLTVLGLLVGVVNAPAGWANVAATAIGTVPSFELNRRWVWLKRGARSIWSEVVPFASLALAGLGLSTLTVHLASTWAQESGWGRLARTSAVEAASIATFGSLWVFQYVLCDRVLFRSREPNRSGARDHGSQGPPRDEAGPVGGMGSRGQGGGPGAEEKVPTPAMPNPAGGGGRD
jgi:putative flippase GtrA